MSSLTLVYGYVQEEQNYPDKAVIFKEGSKSDLVFLLLQGQVKVKKNTGKGLVTLETLKPGSIIGEMMLLDQTQKVRTASVVAEGPVKLGVLDTDRILDEFDQINPKIKALVQALVYSLRKTNDKINSIAVEIT